mmetsp:Transcript_41269/g.66395  ORF Transcript_41269/g.66395 Transcript_41269/m.66395 type:complete len:107 (+) Transcript_41269:927-1247(+)
MIEVRILIREQRDDSSSRGSSFRKKFESNCAAAADSSNLDEGDEKCDDNADINDEEGDIIERSIDGRRQYCTSKSICLKVNLRIGTREFTSSILVEFTSSCCRVNP